VPLFAVLILALVQGVTEFLPISSSAHLELTWRVLDAAAVPIDAGYQGQRLILFVAVHVGTLLAVMLYFWRDMVMLLGGLLRLVTGQGGVSARLALCIILGSIPLFAVGFLAKDSLAGALYDLRIIAWANLGFAILLFICDRLGMTVRRIEHLTLGGALAIGLAQVLALVPGTSRAGVTMTAARLMGFERGEAARVSMLLAVPAIIGAGSLEGYELYQSGNLRLGVDAAMASAFAFAAAVLAIAAMMAWLRRASFTPFVVYRILLGGVLLWLIYGDQMAGLIAR